MDDERYSYDSDDDEINFEESFEESTMRQTTNSATNRSKATGYDEDNRQNID